LIDSFCIIQDSSDDWFTEANSMDMVSRNCVCANAVGTVDNSDGWFITTRNLLSLLPCALSQVISPLIVERLFMF
jgi:hypothetical protein